jgi:hypothetical protein
VAAAEVKNLDFARAAMECELVGEGDVGRHGSHFGQLLNVPFLGGEASLERGLGGTTGLGKLLFEVGDDQLLGSGAAVVEICRFVEHIAE